MRWTERQRAMLAEMGLAVWAPDAGSAASAADAPIRGLLEDTTARAPSAAAPARAERVSIEQSPASPAAVAAPVAEPGAGAPVPASGADGDRTRRIAQLDWPALREAVAGCRACGLCEGRTQTVFGVGHPQAHWMIVGEAPGEQEDLKGEPFVGPAGQLLDAMLRALQLTREGEGPPAQRVYIANTLKCRPPRNRNPQPDEMLRCEPFLIRQIELVRPRIILAMGRFAVQALLRTSEPIGRLRGRVHSYQGVPLIVTYHPAYLLRNRPDKAKSWEDLCLAGQTMERAGAGG